MISAHGRNKVTAKPTAELLISTGVGSTRGSARQNNEDQYYVDPNGRFFIVADGMGGHRGGEVASQLACRVLSHSLDSLCDEDNHNADVGERICKAFAEVNLLINSHRSGDTRFSGMGTTAVVAVLIDRCLYVAWLGDSRGFLIRGAETTQLTTDHSVAQALMEAGVLTAEKAIAHRYRNILWKFLGADDIGSGADVVRITLEPNDRILLATDGLTDRVQLTELGKTVREIGDPQEVTNRLTDMAIRGGSTDDITCVTVFAEPVTPRETAYELKLTNP